jgi:hypothetical protein
MQAGKSGYSRFTYLVKTSYFEELRGREDRSGGLVESEWHASVEGGFLEEGWGLEFGWLVLVEEFCLRGNKDFVAGIGIRRLPFEAEV